MPRIIEHKHKCIYVVVQTDAHYDDKGWLTKIVLHRKALRDDGTLSQRVRLRTFINKRNIERYAVLNSIKQYIGAIETHE